jgi:DNA-binding CsgD family transcriptional regulator
MNLTYEQERQIRQWVLDGLSDDQIARTLFLSVKQIRAIRRAVEEEVRPR